jgi:threonine/homoserine/homoserine lactone efflux protein
MPGPTTLLVFSLASLILVATPGPGVLYVVGRTVDQGRRAGIASMLGIEAAEVVYVLAAAAGLSALLASSATAFDTVRYVGAAYLVYLGIRRWQAGAQEADDAPPASARRIFGEGFLVQLLNPKVAIFFVAYFPQFLDAEGAVVPQVLLLGALYVAIAALSDLVYVLLAERLAGRLRRSVRARLLLARGSALTYIGLGIMAALSGHRASGRHA